MDIRDILLKEGTGYTRNNNNNKAENKTKGNNQLNKMSLTKERKEQIWKEILENPGYSRKVNLNNIQNNNTVK